MALSQVSDLTFCLGCKVNASVLARAAQGLRTGAQMYSAIALGFLVKDSAARRAAAAAQLPGGSLEAVAALVERCLQFYMLAGALSEVNQRSLGALVVRAAAQLPITFPACSFSVLQVRPLPPLRPLGSPIDLPRAGTLVQLDQLAECSLAHCPNLFVWFISCSGSCC